MELWQIIVALGVFVAGLGVGTLLRSSSKQLQMRIKELESDLAESSGQLETHKAEVAQHFEQTSDLFRDLTQQYGSLYAHLSEGARTLCPDRAIEISQGFGGRLLADAAELAAPAAASEAPAEPIETLSPPQVPVAETAATEPTDDEKPALDPETLEELTVESPRPSSEALADNGAPSALR